MLVGSVRRTVRAVALAICACFVMATAGFGLDLTPAQFQSDPGQVLAANSDAGAQLTSLIRQLALADQADLPIIINLLAKASPAQASAIGAGLGEAALAAVRTNQPYAAQIQQAVAAANNPDANVAYAAVTGNQAIGAVGGGAGGVSAGGVGGPTNALGGLFGGAGGVEAIGGNGVDTAPFSATGAVTGVGGIDNNPATSVSP